MLISKNIIFTFVKKKIKVAYDDYILKIWIRKINNIIIYSLLPL